MTPTKTEQVRNSFFFRTVVDWNNIAVDAALYRLHLLPGGRRLVFVHNLPTNARIGHAYLSQAVEGLRRGLRGVLQNEEG